MEEVVFNEAYKDEKTSEKEHEVLFSFLRSNTMSNKFNIK